MGLGLARVDGDRNVTEMLAILHGRGEVAIVGRRGKQRLWDLAALVPGNGDDVARGLDELFARSAFARSASASTRVSGARIRRSRTPRSPTG